MKNNLKTAWKFNFIRILH